MCVVGNNFLAKIIIFHLKQNDQPKKSNLQSNKVPKEISFFSKRGLYVPHIQISVCRRFGVYLMLEEEITSWKLGTN